LTQAREFYNIGRKRLQKGLIDKALEAFLKSEEKNDTDFLLQYILGHLYLYGKDKDCSVINLPQAEKHFRDAARYAQSEISSLPEARRYCGEAYLNASIACYAQASEKNLSGNKHEVEDHLKEAANLAKEATKIYPKLTEGFYQRAKTLALLGKAKVAIQSLRSAIKADRNYCLKADIDRDFESIRPQMLEFFDTLRQQATGMMKDSLDAIEKILDEHVFLSEKAQQIKKEVENLIQQAKDLYKEGTYFDCLDGMEYIGQANKIIAPFLLPYDSLLILRKHTGCARSIAFSPNSWYLASGGEDTMVHLWEIPSGETIKTFEGHRGSVSSICFSPNGRYLASGSWDNMIRLWEISSGKTMTILGGHANHVSSVCFSPDGQYLASGSWDKTIRLWEIPSGRAVTTLEKHTKYVLSLCFSPDGKYLASGSADKTIKLWDLSSNEVLVTRRGHKDDVRSVSFSPDGKYLASGSSDGTIRLWEIPSGKSKMTIQGHKAPVWSVNFKLNSQHLLSGSHDKTIRLWDISSGEIMAIFKGHTDWISSVLFSPDGYYFASASKDRTVRLWGKQHIVSKQELEIIKVRRRQQEEFKLRRRQEENVPRKEYDHQQESEKESLLTNKHQHGHCEKCGSSLGFFDRLFGKTTCKNCR